MPKITQLQVAQPGFIPRLVRLQPCIIGALCQISPCSGSSGGLTCRCCFWPWYLVLCRVSGFPDMGMASSIQRKVSKTPGAMAPLIWNQRFKGMGPTAELRNQRVLDYLHFIWASPNSSYYTEEESANCLMLQGKFQRKQDLNWFCRIFSGSQ